MKQRLTLNRSAPVFLIMLALALLPLCGGAWASMDCGPTPVPMPGGAGPFDYWTDQDKLKVVEDFHFTPKVETLREGQSSYLGGDIGYTLSVIPNHPRALLSIIRLSEREKKNRPHGAKYSVECYLDRAIRFRPKDATARMIFGMYLAKLGRNEEALKQLEVAKENAEGNANLFYNMGLVYFDLKQYEDALYYAHQAYQRRFPLPGLRHKLQKAGKWSEPSVVDNVAETTPEDEGGKDTVPGQ